MKNHVENKLKYYVDCDIDDRPNIKILIEDFFMCGECDDVIEVLIKLSKKFPEFDERQDELELLKEFSTKFSEACDALIPIMATEVDTMQGKQSFRNVVFKECCTYFEKIKNMKDKLCFEKKAMQFIESYKLFELESRLRRSGSDPIDQAELYKLGYLYGSSCGSFEFLYKFLTGKRLEFYHSARQSYLMKIRHGKAILYERAVELAQKLWYHGDQKNHSEMAKFIINNYPKFKDLSVESLREHLREVGRVFGLTKGSPGYKGK